MGDWSNGVVRRAMGVAVLTGAVLATSTVGTAQAAGPQSGFSPVVVGQPTASQEADGRLAVFARGTDGALWYDTQAVPNGGWGGWRNLGGTLQSDPVAARNADGRISVFAQGKFGNDSDRLVTITESEPDSTSYGDWSNLGGPLYNPNVGRNADGRLTVVGTAGSLWEKTQSEPDSATYNGWKKIETTNPVGRPALVNQADGRLMVVYRREGNNVAWHVDQTAPNSTDWGNPVWIGGVLGSDPAAIRDVDGKVSTFVRGTDGKMWAATQNDPNGAPFATFRQIGTGTYAQQDRFAAERQADGRFHVFARGMNNQVYVTPQQGATTMAYNTQSSINGAQTASLATGVNHDGTVVVFGRANDGKIWSAAQTGPNQNYGPWSIVN